MAHAQREEESLKKHGDALESATGDRNSHISDGNGKGANVKTANIDPIPKPEKGSHEKSHAAHLGGAAHEQTRPQGNLRQGAAPGELREPPQEVSRVGKEHRKQ